MPERIKIGWARVAFGDVARLVRDHVNPEDTNLERYVAGEHMSTDDLRIRRWGLIGDGYLGPAFHMRFKLGQVLYGSRRTYLRKVAVAEFEGITANTTFVIESKSPNVLLPALLPFIMQTESFHRHSIKESKGSVNPYINFTDLSWYQFALPPINEQREIVHVLSTIEKARNAIDSALGNGAHILRGLSSEHFSTISAMKDLLSSHYCIVSGQVDPRKSGYSRLPLIAPNHIEGHTGRLLELKSAADQCAISGKYLFEKGTVLYSKIRPNLMKATIAPCRGLCSADIYALIPKDTIRPEYLLELLLSSRFTQFAVSGSMRTGIPKLNREHLEKFQQHVPNLDVQDRYLANILDIRDGLDRLTERKSRLIDLKRKILEVFDHAI